MFTTLRFALRGFRATPLLTLTALATLALCLGANLTLFALVDAVLLRPLPYREPDRLVTLYHAYPKLGLPRNGASLTTYYERRGRLPAFESLAALNQATSLLGETGATSREPIGRVTPEFFATLGVAPVRGRAFVEGELTYQTDHVAVLSYEYWQRQFAGDPHVLERSVRVDGIPRRIIGVLPPDFRYLSFAPPVYLPLSSEDGERNIAARHALGTLQVARLRPGVTLAAAQAQVDADDRAHAAEFPEAQAVTDAGFRTVVAPLHGEHVEGIRRTLVLLQAGGALLLVIGAVNLVNLWLVRATARMRQYAIRQALGAGRRQIVAEIVVETLLVAVGGALLGLAAADSGIRVLAALGAESLPLGARLGLDARVAAAGIAAALLTSLAVAIPVAAFAVRGGLAGAMQAESRSATAGRTVERLRRSFIVAQIGLAFVLLAGASLLGLSLRRAMNVAPGFATEGTVTGQFTLPWSGYHAAAAFDAFFTRLVAEARGLPGVTAAGAATSVPVTQVPAADAVTVDGETLAPGTPPAMPAAVGVAGDYFRAMGVPLRAGRFLDASDTRLSSAFTCVVDDAFAGRHWPRGGAVGGRVFRGVTREPGDRPCTVVGVVGAVKLESLTSAADHGAIYYPYQYLRVRAFHLVVRTRSGADVIAPVLGRLLRRLDPELPLTDVRSMDARVSDSLQPRRAPAVAAGLFAGAALLLALIGLYGVMAYAVAARTSEFGIRLALGAVRADLLRLVLRQGAGLVAVGLAVGVTLSAASAAAVRPLLYDVSPFDPLALGAVTAALAGVATLACLVPALRAARVTPLTALRHD